MRAKAVELVTVFLVTTYDWRPPLSLQGGLPLPPSSLPSGASHLKDLKDSRFEANVGGQEAGTWSA